MFSASVLKSMASTLLQRFLDAGLFNFGDEDQRLKDFQLASDDLAKAFANSPEKVIPAILVAIDPEVPDGDPVLGEVEAAIKGHWNSFRNKFPERPKGFLRPVLLDALCQAATGNTEIASAICLSGASLLQHLRSSSEERTIVEEFLLNQILMMETAAEKTWAVARPEAEFTVPTLTFKIPEIQGVGVDQPALEEGLAAASGPSNQQNRRHANANPYWPNNQGSNWVWEFAPRAAATISEQVNKALAPLAGQTNVLVEQVEPELKKFGKEVSAAISQWVNASVRGLAQRSSLLWWKEALYSPGLRTTYRELSPVEVAVGMALDLHLLASAPSPKSIEFFLRETIHAVLPKRLKISISEVLTQANRSKLLGDIVVSKSPPEAPHRVSFLTAVQFARHTKFADDSLPGWLGVRGDLRLQVAELAVWLFRDAQAISLTDKPTKK
jgi:hypothetical protein